MTNEAIIGILGLISAMGTTIGSGAVMLAFKNQGRITKLEAESEPQKEFVGRISKLEANAENHSEMIKEHRQESKDFRKALEQNTLAIHELTTLIKHKL
jgi:hypothetical protein